MVDEDLASLLWILNVADNVDGFLIGCDVPELARMLAVITQWEMLNLLHRMRGLGTRLDLAESRFL